jgi:release factor glutamine methyltransferase
MRDLLKESHESEAMREARSCLLYALTISATELINNPHMIVEPQSAINALELAKRRAKGEPMAYLTGAREFWGRMFQVSPATLIPRPDSETLIETILKTCPDHTAPFHILDLGTGSGCLLITLLCEYPYAQGIGIDISRDALTIAAQNAINLNVASRVTWHNGSWFEALNTASNSRKKRFDIVISNPPYIPQADIAALESDVRDYEPLNALNGGQDGLDAYRLIIGQVTDYLIPHGLFICEVGVGQANDVKQLCENHGLIAFPIVHDLGGIARVVGGRKKG